MRPTRKQTRARAGRAAWWAAAFAGGAAVAGGCAERVELDRKAHPKPPGREVAEAEPGAYGGVFVLASSTEPKTFNFLVPGDAATSDITGRLFNGLTTYDPMKRETIPALAKSWDIGADKKTYTFHLRDIRWSDGEPFTAEDVIFTFDAIFAKEPETGSGDGERDYRYPSRYTDQYTIDGETIDYRKIDEHTVEFTTPRVYAPFLNDIGFVPIMPEHKLREAFEDGTLQKRWSTETAIERPNAIVGTGPYRIRDYRPGERLVLEPNPHYWRFDREGKRLPYIDFVVYNFVKEQNTQTILFATGQTDAASVPVTEIGWVREAAKNRDFEVRRRGPSTSISFFWFNQHPGSDASEEPYVAPYKLAWFRDIRFRRAVMHGFDRAGVVEGVYFGRAQVLHSVISPGNAKWHNPDVKKYPHDPGKARRLLRDAGFEYRGEELFGPEGNRVEWELLLYDGSQQASSMATTLKENMAELGMAVKISLVDFSTVLKRTNSTFDYEMSYIGWTGGGDPSGGKAMYSSSGLYHVWYPEQPEPATEWEATIDRLLARSERTLDESKRVELFGRIQEIFARQVPVMFTVVPDSYSGIQEKWRNVEVPPTGSIIWNLDEIWTPQEEALR